MASSPQQAEAVAAVRATQPAAKPSPAVVVEELSIMTDVTKSNFLEVRHIGKRKNATMYTLYC